MGEYASSEYHYLIQYEFQSTTSFESVTGFQTNFDLKLLSNTIIRHPFILHFLWPIKLLFYRIFANLSKFNLFVTTIHYEIEFSIIIMFAHKIY